ncbi:MAG: RHS repeat protein [Candidatus Omnitrophica bacterium]|nr:RHS repeat protein [Candidatus Omnitrophota bacterium]
MKKLLIFILFLIMPLVAFAQQSELPALSVQLISDEHEENPSVGQYVYRGTYAYSWAITVPPQVDWHWDSSSITFVALDMNPHPRSGVKPGDPISFGEKTSHTSVRVGLAQWHQEVVDRFPQLFVRVRFYSLATGDVLTVTTYLDGRTTNSVEAGAFLKTGKMVPDRLKTMTQDPIDIATGVMYTKATDLFYPLPGGGLFNLTRTYATGRNDGLFGHGWRTPYDQWLNFDDDGGAVVNDENGANLHFLRNNDGSFVSMVGNYSTLVENGDGSFTRTDKNGNVFVYDAEGDMVLMKDRNGNALRYIYDPARPESAYLEDPGGQRIKVLFNDDELVSAIIDPLGRTTRYTYENSCNLATVTYPDGRVVRYVYDNDHNIIQITNANGHKTYYAYDLQGRAYQNWQDGDVNKATLDFKDNNTTEVTDSLGNKTTYVFNSMGLETSRTDALGHTSRTEWDSKMNKTAVIDANGNRTAFEYDAKGNLLKITDALGRVTRYTYTSDYNLLKTTTNALGGVTTNDYDARGNLTSVIDPLNARTSLAYDSKGNLVSITDALLRKTTMTYNSYGQMIQSANALGGTRRFTYDKLGKVLAAIDPRGAQTLFSYDIAGRLVRMTAPNGAATSYAYDSLGNRIRLTDPKLRVTTNVYDGYERLVKTIDPLGGMVQTEYDTAGRIISLTDEKGQITYRTVDPVGRLQVETTPLGSTRGFTYDPAGNIISRTFGNAAPIVHTYDALNRLTRVAYPDSKVVAYEYDALGRKTSMTDSQGVTTYEYDALGRLLGETGPLAGYKISYTYDLAGNRLSTTDQDGNRTTYVYDALNRVTSLKAPAGITTYAYDFNSNVMSIDYPNRIRNLRTYDLLNRVLAVVNVNAKNGKVIDQEMYTYDLGGFISKKARLGINAQTVNYTYDAKGQLVRETNTGKYDYEYAYDPAGNRVSFKKNTTVNVLWGQDSGILSPVVQAQLRSAGYGPALSVDLPLVLKKAYTYDAENKLLQYSRILEVQGNAFTTDTTAYDYDDRGNRIQRTVMTVGAAVNNVSTYGYDLESRLVALTANGITAAFQYSGDGRRTKAVRDGQETTFLYDGQNVVLEKNASLRTTRSYVRGQDYPGGVGGIIYFRNMINTAVPPAPAGGEQAGVAAAPEPQTTDPGRVYYFHYDCQGGVQDITDVNGNDTGDYGYDAFGRDNKHSGIAGSNVYKFSTKEWEGYAGLYYFGARYYEPETGRWLTPDPLGMADGFNKYLYLHNDPVNFLDPLGLLSIAYNAGAHAPVTAGVAVGGNWGSELRNPLSPDARLKGNGFSPEIVYGEIFDIGGSAGLSDISGSCGEKAGDTIGVNFPWMGKYGGVQVTMRNDISWNNPGTWIPDSVQVGLGLGVALPVTYTTSGAQATTGTVPGNQGTYISQGR